MMRPATGPDAGQRRVIYRKRRPVRRAECPAGRERHLQHGRAWQDGPATTWSHRYMVTGAASCAVSLRAHSRAPVLALCGASGHTSACVSTCGCHLCKSTAATNVGACLQPQTPSQARFPTTP